MKLQILLAFVGLTLATEFADETFQPDSERKAEADVIFAGAVEGKAFWAVLGPSVMNWTTAGSNCVERNMKFAEITSQAQAQVIVAAQNATPGFPSGAFWTSGRDALETRQFSWNASNTDVSNSDLRIADGYADIKNAKSCVLFVASTGLLWPLGCGDSIASGYLCEVSIGKGEKV